MKKIILLFLISSVVNAQSSWNELSPEQQKILLPFESNWNELDSVSQQSFIDNTNKWLNMSESDKKKAKLKLIQFKQKTPQEQKQIKHVIGNYNQLSRQDRKDLNRMRKQFENLTTAQKQRAKKKFEQLPKHQRQDMLRQHTKAREKMLRALQSKQLREYFDNSTRKTIVRMFKRLPRNERKMLKVHLYSLLPQPRHDLILDLLDMQPNNRILAIKTL